jgi:hypothetical protein
MEQGPLVKVQEQVEEWVWVVVLVEEGWVETALGRALVEVAFALVVGRRLLTK